MGKYTIDYLLPVSLVLRDPTVYISINIYKIIYHIKEQKLHTFLIDFLLVGVFSLIFPLVLEVYPKLGLKEKM